MVVVALATLAGVAGVCARERDRKRIDDLEILYCFTFIVNKLKQKC